MITCPKCGFLQPPDRFCANCGVDIEKYHRAQRRSLIKKFFGSSLFQAALIILIVLLTSFIIYQKKQLEIRSLRDRLASEEIQDNKRDISLDRKVSPPAPEPSAPLPAPKLDVGVSAKNILGAVPPARKKNKVLEAPSASAILKISFVDLGIGAANRLRAMAYPLRVSGQTQIYSLADLEDQYQQSQDAQDLLVIKEEDPITAVPRQKINLDETVLDSLSRPIGIRMQITPSLLDKQGLHFGLALSRLLPTFQQNGNPNLNEMHLNQTFVLPNKAGVFILGSLPHHPISVAEQQDLANSVLRVMSFPDFQGGASDFVIFIFAETP